MYCRNKTILNLNEFEYIYIYMYIYIKWTVFVNVCKCHLQNGCLHDVRDASFVCDLSQFLTAWRLVLSMNPWSYIWLEFGLFSTIIYIYAKEWCQNVWYRTRWKIAMAFECDIFVNIQHNYLSISNRRFSRVFFCANRALSSVIIQCKFINLQLADNISFCQFEIQLRWAILPTIDLNYNMNYIMKRLHGIYEYTRQNIITDHEK